MVSASWWVDGKGPPPPPPQKKAQGWSFEQTTVSNQHLVPSKLESPSMSITAQLLKGRLQIPNGQTCELDSDIIHCTQLAAQDPVASYLPPYGVSKRLFP